MFCFQEIGLTSCVMFFSLLFFCFSFRFFFLEFSALVFYFISSSSTSLPYKSVLVTSFLLDFGFYCVLLISFSLRPLIVFSCFRLSLRSIFIASPSPTFVLIMFFFQSSFSNAFSVLLCLSAFSSLPFLYQISSSFSSLSFLIFFPFINIFFSHIFHSALSLKH